MEQRLFCFMGAMTTDSSTSTPIPKPKLARNVFTSFLLTFIAARVLVILIMGREIPDMFLHMGQTHVHHLNYGIFLLTGTGAYLIFCRPVGKLLSATSVFYGIGLALTFDEFGIW